MTGNEAELQKTIASSLLIAVLIPKELKGDRHKYKGQVILLRVGFQVMLPVRSMENLVRPQRGENSIKCKMN